MGGAPASWTAHARVFSGLETRTATGWRRSMDDSLVTRPGSCRQVRVRRVYRQSAIRTKWPSQGFHRWDDFTCRSGNILGLVVGSDLAGSY
jgi:hypothetical protein